MGFLALFLLLTAHQLTAQLLGEVSLGRSGQDRVVGQLSVRRQFSDRFRVGITLQAGAPAYRFIAAKPLGKGGYSLAVTAPATLVLSQQEGIQLLGTLRLGLRFQGVIDPDANDRRDSVLASTALLGEVGFIANIPAGQHLHFQSGVSFPVGYELEPASLLEYQWTNLHGGVSYHVNRQVWFVRANAGSAFGASGDTYKFMWSLQAGMRISLGATPGSFFHVIESTIF